MAGKCNCCHDNTRAVLSTAIPMIVIGLVLGLIPQTYRAIQAFGDCIINADIEGVPVKSSLEFCFNAAKDIDSVTIYLALTEAIAFVVMLVLAILFMIFTCLSCGASTCIKYTTRIFVTISLALTGHVATIATAVLFGAEYDYIGEFDRDCYEVSLLLGNNAPFQMVALAMAWFVGCLLTPVLTCRNNCCGKTVIVILVAAIAGAASEMFVWIDPYKVNDFIAKENEYTLGVVLVGINIVIAVLQCCFCFCGAQMHGACCCKSRTAKSDEEKLLDQA